LSHRQRPQRPTAITCLEAGDQSRRCLARANATCESKPQQEHPGLLLHPCCRNYSTRVHSNDGYTICEPVM